MYFIGVAFITVTHLIFGWDNPHAPPTSFLVVLAVVMLGLFRFVKNAFNILHDRDKERSKGELLIHVFIFSLLALFFFWVYLTAV